MSYNVSMMNVTTTGALINFNLYNSYEVVWL